MGELSVQQLAAGLVRSVCSGGQKWRSQTGSSCEETKIATWLILPVVICLSQRLSHACLSISFYTVKLRMAH